MTFPRSTGILLHPISLPSPGGIGDFGPAAYEFLDFLGHVIPLGLAAGLAQIARHDAQVRGAGIFGVVDAVTEAGNFFLLLQHLADVSDRVSLLPVDSVQEAEDGFVGAAMQWALQCSDG